MTIGEETIFKGGTALSKCYQLINRFSEDIDLVVLRREGENDNQLKKKLKTISNLVSEELPEIKGYDLTLKRGMIRKTAHSYAKQFKEDFGQVRDVIVVEATWFGHYEPFTTRIISSYIGDMMLNNGQEAIAEEYGLLPFGLRVLEPTRTICEKIMSLVRFSYTAKPIEDLKTKVRHTYDLHQLLKEQEFSDFFDSRDFDAMFLKVANDDIKSFKNGNEWLSIHPKEALIFSDLENVWQELEPVYNGIFKALTYGDFPSETEVLKTLNRIKDRISHIDWNIGVNDK
jgi:predicted nucleotidyltransferase component of viral defense system